jgi:hypothetical protein
MTLLPIATMSPPTTIHAALTIPAPRLVLADEYPVNALLAVVYPDLAPHPCAECCKAPGTHLRADAEGTRALVCRSCSRFPRPELDFRLRQNELEVVRLHVEAEAQAQFGTDSLKNHQVLP